MQVDVLKRCLGLNTRDHPTELYTEKGAYLSKAVNVDITDNGGIQLRQGNTLVTGDLSNAHSLEPFLDRYLIYADDAILYCYDSEDETISEIKTDITPDILISYTNVGETLVFSNGTERGCITKTSSGVQCGEYFSFVQEDTDSPVRVASFPLVDLMYFFSGSMYGAAKGTSFLYSSVPYKPGKYNKTRGYILLKDKINWINSIESALLVGTEAGVIAFVGHGLVDFQEKTLLPFVSKSCSRLSAVTMGDGASTYKGVFTLTDKGIFFITELLEVIDMTTKLPVDWSGISKGCFEVNDKQYIFSGEL